ncbi:MAG: sialidase family protein, partial [Planctomycetota bacterium]
MMLCKLQLSMGAVFLCCPCVYSKWLEISDVKVSQYSTELAGPKIVAEYDIEDPNISPTTPAYVFVRYSTDSGKTWQLVPMDSLRGNGFDIVETPGHKEIIWWGTGQTRFNDLDQVAIRIRGIAMAS